MGKLLLTGPRRRAALSKEATANCTLPSANYTGSVCIAASNSAGVTAAGPNLPTDTLAA